MRAVREGRLDIGKGAHMPQDALTPVSYTHLIISERTVGLYMHELGIHAHYVKPRTQTKIDSNFSDGLKNILDERFNPDEPNAYWCTDITYI